MKNVGDFGMDFTGVFRHIPGKMHLLWMTTGEAVDGPCGFPTNIRSRNGGCSISILIGG